MRKTYVTAIVIAVLISVWLASGQLGNEVVRHPSLADVKRDYANKQADRVPTKVRVQVIEASAQTRRVKVRGKTENKRTVNVKVETSGRITGRNVERGTGVQSGDVLCELSKEDRPASLVEVREALNQAEIEYKGALSLQQRGFNSETAIATTRAKLAAAQADVNRRELDLAKTEVRAPFAGIVEDVHQEVGDYVRPGDPCATVVDLDPMLLVGRVSEKIVHDLTLGAIARGILNDGRVIQGAVTFIGQQSDAATRTYPVEIQVDNSRRELRSGITTEILIPVQTVMAHIVSPALFALDDAGDIGVRTIDQHNIVQYHPIEVLSDADDGVWITGLPNRATIITVGHQLVVEGERVDPVFADPMSVNAAVPQSSTSRRMAMDSPG